MEKSRRNFIQKVALGFAGTAAIPFTNNAAITQKTTPKQGNLLPLGIAGYTFQNLI